MKTKPLTKDEIIKSLKKRKTEEEKLFYLAKVVARNTGLQVIWDKKKNVVKTTDLKSGKSWDLPFSLLKSL